MTSRATLYLKDRDKIISDDVNTDTLSKVKMLLGLCESSGNMVLQ